MLEGPRATYLGAVHGVVSLAFCLEVRSRRLGGRWRPLAHLSWTLSGRCAKGRRCIPKPQIAMYSQTTISVHK
jgi:hypothetical protein